MSVLAERFQGEEYFHSGHPFCPGCPGGIMMRWITKILGKDTIAGISASCMALPTMVYPHSMGIPCLYIGMSTSPATISGVSAAIKVLKRKKRISESRKINVIAVAGDGSAADIGMACLSGAAERNDDGIFFCFDNEAYMNTGIQRSSMTPQFTWTTSTIKGKGERKKDLPKIMAAHNVPYVATVSLAFPEDFMNKVEKARDMDPGFKYIHVHSPCPTGWRFPERKTIEVARMAVETGLWPLYEVSYGSPKITYYPVERKSVEEYLNLQGRFKDISAENIRVMQEEVDAKFKELEID